LLPEVDGIKGSTELKSKLRDHLAKPYRIDHLSLVVTASIGIAVYPTDGVTHHDLLSRADSAMYQAKTDGNSVSRDA
jgi:diguanylate cyclase (GGDEF)-like protein